MFDDARGGTERRWQVDIPGDGHAPCGEVSARVALHEGIRGVQVGGLVGKGRPAGDVCRGDSADIFDHRGTLCAGDIAREVSGEGEGAVGRRRAARRGGRGGIAIERAAEGSGGGAAQCEAGGELGVSHRTGRDRRAGHRPCGHRLRLLRLRGVQGIPHRGDPLVGCKQHVSIRSVVEPHAQIDLAVIGEHAGRHGRHVCQRRVAEAHRVEALGDRQRHRGGRLAAGRPDVGAVVGPVGFGGSGVHQRELERAGAVEVHATDGDAALVVEDIRHRRGERDDEGQMKKEGEEAVGDGFHGWLMVAGSRGRIRDIMSPPSSARCRPDCWGISELFSAGRMGAVFTATAQCPTSVRKCPVAPVSRREWLPGIPLASTGNPARPGDGSWSVMEMPLRKAGESSVFERVPHLLETEAFEVLHIRRRKPGNAMVQQGLCEPHVEDPPPGETSSGSDLPDLIHDGRVFDPYHIRDFPVRGHESHRIIRSQGLLHDRWVAQVIV